MRDKDDTLVSMSKNLCINYVWSVRNISRFRIFTCGNFIKWMYEGKSKLFQMGAMKFSIQSQDFVFESQGVLARDKLRK